MRKTGITMLVALGFTFGAAACGGDSDSAAVKDELMTELGLTESEAQCVVDELGGDASVILKLSNPDFAPNEDQVVALDRAGDECGLE